MVLNSARRLCIAPAVYLCCSATEFHVVRGTYSYTRRIKRCLCRDGSTPVRMTNL